MGREVEHEESGVKHNQHRVITLSISGIAILAIIVALVILL